MIFPRIHSLSRTLLIAFCLLLSSSSSFSQKPGKKLTFEQAFQNGKPQVLESLPSILDWMDDAPFLLEERDEKNRLMQIFKVNAHTGEKTLIVDSSKIQKNLPEGLNAAQIAAFAPDYTHWIYLIKGDLYDFSTHDGKVTRLTETPGEEKNPRFSPDGRFVAYTRNNDLYALDIEKKMEHQLTSDGSKTISNGWASWVYYEEILGRPSHYAAFWWSPDSTRIAFLRFDDSPVPKFNLVKSKGTHGELEVERYPKSGDPNPFVRLGIVPSAGGKAVWADVEEKADHYVAWPVWLPDSSQLTFQWMNRGQDNIKIYAVDPDTGKIHEIYNETQPAWVEFFEDLHFFKNGSGFLLRSSADGWRHLYIYDMEGRLKKRLTQGEWTITDIARVDEKNDRVFFHGRKGDTTETHLFVVNLGGTGLKRLTQEPGTHNAHVSPEGGFFIDDFSSCDSPPRLDLFHGNGTYLREIGQSQTSLMKEYMLGKKELLAVPTEDGWTLPAYWILPPDFDEHKKYPVLFEIYSGPESGTVYNEFPSLSQLFLAQEGIIVFSVDHRGSGHFGKKGVDLMHRNLGKWEMHDLIEAVKWLRQKPFIDRDKVGITGGSYGGYTTCLALTCGADYFTHGYARSSVTDWKLYDSVYTERYMDRPEENKDGYKSGSVLTYAGKLKGTLFFCHGDIDDNVHVQNSVQLINTFMDLSKKFEFMLYPNQRHRYSGKKRAFSNRHFVDFWFKHFLNR